MLQPDGDAQRLDGGQPDRAIAGILVDDLAAGLAFLFQGFQFRKHRRHQLDDDGGRDIGHDAKREDRHAADGAAGQGIEHIQKTAAGLVICCASAAGSIPGIGI